MLSEYFREYHRLVDNSNLLDLVTYLRAVEDVAGKVFLVGNGASSAIASHCSLDLCNVGVEAMAFTDPSMLTAYANDYGYDSSVVHFLGTYANDGDTVILISSSGKSRNMLKGAGWAKEHNLNVITFTGFSKDNPLSKLGDMNFWVDSKVYNIVECMHMIWLTAVIDELS